MLNIEKIIEEAFNAGHKAHRNAKGFSTLMLLEKKAKDYAKTEMEKLSCKSEQNQHYRSVDEIIEKIDFYKTEEKRYKKLNENRPNDFDIKRELYGYASKIFALEWVVNFKNDIVTCDCGWSGLESELKLKEVTIMINSPEDIEVCPKCENEWLHQ